MGRDPERPFLFLVQPTLFDSSRAPAGRHVAWAYCHIPIGSTLHMTDRIEAQIERFAPGFRDCILRRHAMRPGDLEEHNPNLVDGSINGGANDRAQLVARPILSSKPLPDTAQSTVCVAIIVATAALEELRKKSE